MERYLLSDSCYRNQIEGDKRWPLDPFGGRCNGPKSIHFAYLFTYDENIPKKATSQVVSDPTTCMALATL